MTNPETNDDRVSEFLRTAYAADPDVTGLGMLVFLFEFRNALSRSTAALHALQDPERDLTGDEVTALLDIAAGGIGQLSDIADWWHDQLNTLQAQADGNPSTDP